MSASRILDERLRSTLSAFGLRGVGRLNANQAAAVLFEEAVRRGEGQLSEHGALVVQTGEHTGRAAKDKYIVVDGETRDRVHWGEANQPLDPEKWRSLWTRAKAFVDGKELFVQDLFVGADPAERLPIRVISQRAWHGLFARNMFIRPSAPSEIEDHHPRFTVVDLPDFHAAPASDGTRSETAVVLNVSDGIVLIAGTAYAGEIKKSIFTAMNYLLPQHGVLTMHCAANVGARGDVAIFFGLSGTGKTTLSTEPDRGLIGDDEHGWSDRGVFNLEGGCYAKVIRLSAEAEPEIFATTRRFGTLLENVILDEELRRVDLDDDRKTENTRASYPLDFIPNAVAGARAGQPQHIVLLTADAFGVLPPIASLSTAQAMFHFLSGFTAKLAGTEIGVKEPRATFSTCFGAPFMPLHPGIYAQLLGERMKKTGARAWLVNTGWSGGPYGVGQRMKIAHTRTMLRAALGGLLDDVERDVDPVFGLAIPREVPGVPSSVLSPRNAWSDPAAYDRQARAVADLFVKNFAQYAGGVSTEVREAAPGASTHV